MTDTDKKNYKTIKEKWATEKSAFFTRAGSWF